MLDSKCTIVYIMPNPNALYEDMEKLNALYEELCWDHDDELVFTHDGNEIIVYNKTKEGAPVPKTDFDSKSFGKKFQVFFRCARFTMKIAVIGGGTGASHAYGDVFQISREFKNRSYS